MKVRFKGSLKPISDRQRFPQQLKNDLKKCLTFTLFVGLVSVIFRPMHVFICLFCLVTSTSSSQMDNFRVSTSESTLSSPKSRGFMLHAPGTRGQLSQHNSQPPVYPDFTTMQVRKMDGTVVWISFDQDR